MDHGPYSWYRLFFFNIKFHCGTKLTVNSRLEVFCKKSILRNYRKIHRKAPVPESLLNKVAAQACNFTKKETLAQVFCCEFCEISKSAFFYRTPLVAASGFTIYLISNDSLLCFEFMESWWLKVRQVNWTEHLFCSVNRKILLMS